MQVYFGNARTVVELDPSTTTTPDTTPTQQVQPTMTIEQGVAYLTQNFSLPDWMEVTN